MVGHLISTLFGDTDLSKFASELSELEQYVFEMAFTHEMSFSEIAAILKTSEGEIERIWTSVSSRAKTYVVSQGVPVGDLIWVAEEVSLVKQLTPGLIEHLRSRHDALDKLHPDLVEDLVGEFFASWGYKHVRVVGRNPSTGADVAAVQRVQGGGAEVKYFIEVKRKQDAVGIGVVQGVAGAMFMEQATHGWHVGMIVTTGAFAEFKRYTTENLKNLRVEFKDRADILSWLEGYKVSPRGLWLPPRLRK